MDFQNQTGRTIKDAFIKFHLDNPTVYELYKAQVFRAIRLKKKKISSKQILGYLRWETFLYSRDDMGFRINDAFTAWYARLFRKHYPQYREIFEFRRIRS